MNGSALDLAAGVLAVVLSAIFLVSGGAKVLSSQAFGRILVTTYGFPADAARKLAVAFPVVELVCALALFIPELRLPGLVTATVSLAAVLLVVSMAWISGRTGDCGCFGSLSAEQLSAKTVVRAAVLAGTALLALSMHLSLEPRFGLPTGPLEYVGVGLVFLLAPSLAWRSVRLVRRLDEIREDT